VAVIVQVSVIAHAVIVHHSAEALLAAVVIVQVSVIALHAVTDHLSVIALHAVTDHLSVIAHAVIAQQADQQLVAEALVLNLALNNS
jgi:hypothetical protein